MSKKSVQEVSKVEERKYAKTDSRHWGPRLFRNSFTKDGVIHHTAAWCIKLAYAGRRETINLRTANQAAAATKAAALYKLVLSKGWDAALAEYKPKAVAKAPEAATVGDVIREVEKTAGFRPSTFTAYSQSLRTLTAGIADIGDQIAVDKEGNVIRNRKGDPVVLSRRDFHGRGRDAWRAKVDAVRVDRLTPEQVQRWKLAYIAKAGAAPDARRRAENTATSLIRCSRALFSEKALRFARANLSLPTPLPFAGVKLDKKPSTRYVSRIDARTLVAEARKELGSDPEHLQPFKLFCLALMCGLRKAEADTLLWHQVDLDSGKIRIEPTEHFMPKSEDSIGEIDLDDELLALLRGWKAKATSDFVVESPVSPRSKPSGRAWYRCQQHFITLYQWLKSKGVTVLKPLHELRKELGAILASDHGIFAAQRVLRHAQISTTAAYYADKKRRITAGLGSLLTDDAKTIPFPVAEPAPSQAPEAVLTIAATACA